MAVSFVGPGGSNVAEYDAAGTMAFGSILEGDLLFRVFTSGPTGGDSVVTSAGWTKIAGLANSIWYKKASAADVAAGGVAWIGSVEFVFALRGQHPTSPIHLVGSSNGVGFTAIHPSIITTLPNMYLVRMDVRNDNDGYTSISGATFRQWGRTNTNHTGYTIGEGFQAAAGATGTSSDDWNDSNFWNVYTFAITAEPAVRLLQAATSDSLDIDIPSGGLEIEGGFVYLRASTLDNLEITTQVEHFHTKGLIVPRHLVWVYGIDGTKVGVVD